MSNTVRILRHRCSMLQPVRVSHQLEHKVSQVSLLVYSNPYPRPTVASRELGLGTPVATSRFSAVSFSPTTAHMVGRCLLVLSQPLPEQSASGRFVKFDDSPENTIFCRGCYGLRAGVRGFLLSVRPAMNAADMIGRDCTIFSSKTRPLGRIPLCSMLPTSSPTPIPTPDQIRA